MCSYIYIEVCICVFAYVNIYQDYLYAVFYTFTCYAQQSCYIKGMEVRRWVTVSIPAVCIQVCLLVESKASTNQYSYLCTQAVRSTASSCFGINSIVFVHNLQTKTSSGNIRIHRYFRACKHSHEVVDNFVCLSLLLIISLARSSMLCDAVLCNLCLLACVYGSWVWIAATVQARKRFGARFPRHVCRHLSLHLPCISSQSAAFSVQHAISLESLGRGG